MKHPLLPSRDDAAALIAQAEITVVKGEHPLEMSKHQRWYYSAKGVLWLARSRERRRAYQREYSKRPDRRAYLTEYQRQYRARNGRKD